MLLTMIDVVSCENPKCRDFAKIIPGTYGLRSYYCPLCATVSYARPVDAALATMPQRYLEYLRQLLTSPKESVRA